MAIATRVITVNPENPAEWAMESAAQILMDKGLVAFATETVYGLGADASDPAAVARIFEAKGRPAFNPLIVHTSGVEMARKCVSEWPEAAAALSRAFWPGPLTMVLPRSARIPDIVTAGLSTVGVRVPATVVARSLIAYAGRPLAAPSANRSSSLSPTRARHVTESLGGRIELVLDSGPTELGLESTILDLSSRTPRILRPGPILASEIESVLQGEPVVDAPQRDPEGPITSPGQLAIHYAPRTRTLRADQISELAGIEWPQRAALVAVGSQCLPALPTNLRQFHLETPAVAARDLYAVLHQCDASSLELIVVLRPPDLPEWSAIRDRLQRAAAPVEPDSL